MRSPHVTLTHQSQFTIQTMPDFFGKSGNVWAGIQYIVRPDPNSMDLSCFYYDGYTNDSKEDSFSSLSFTEICQGIFYSYCCNYYFLHDTNYCMILLCMNAGHFFTRIFPTLFPEYDMQKGLWYTGIFDGAGNIQHTHTHTHTHSNV